VIHKRKITKTSAAKLRGAGPKTPAGKRRVAQNARRHGLSIPVCLDPKFSQEVEALAHKIAGPGAGDQKLDHARLIAEAQVDLTRIRTTRLELLADQTARTPRLTISQLKRALTRLKKLEDFEEAFERMECLIDGEPEGGNYPSLESGMNVLAQKLLRLERYERRALSRRKFAIRAFDALPGEETLPADDKSRK
jgi:hypothetical protein